MYELDERYQCGQCGNMLTPVCFYCGEVVSDRETFENHVQSCPKHPIAAMKRELVELFRYAYHLPSCQVMSPLGDKVMLPCDCGYVEWYKRMEEGNGQG